MSWTKKKKVIENYRAQIDENRSMAEAIVKSGRTDSVSLDAIQGFKAEELRLEAEIERLNKLRKFRFI